MLSYRHAFHAGNHADVLKHFIYSLVLTYFNQKDKAYWVIDTHAGAGMYQLDDVYAQKNKEFDAGFARLVAATNLPDALGQYVQMVKSFNSSMPISLYPGSPKVAAAYLRTHDKLRLFELHPTDYQHLSSIFSGQARQTKIEMSDGFNGLKACLPPATRRAVVLIDPPYEIKDDYQRVVTCIKDSLTRFSSGTYLIWYPLLQRPEPMQMALDLEQLGLNNWVHTTLTVQTPSHQGFGMHGSGMFIINPPWTLPAQLEQCMPILSERLGLDSSANFSLKCHIT